MPLSPNAITVLHWRRTGLWPMLPRVWVAVDSGVRSLEPADWPAVRAIYELGRATGRATLETATPSWELWDTVHVRGHRWVAVVDDDVVGWAALAHAHRTAGSGVAESSVYVDPSCHRRGIGGTLLGRLVAESERAGFWTLEARVVDGNDASLRLHLANGFRVVGVREHIGRLHGAWCDVLLLERRSRVVGV
jgi:L-amino acid N-acyltransferase YncA